MRKKLQLQIPIPCHENWDDMSALDQGRFCASCQKQVIDFSNMSDREIALFFKKPSTDSVCGRFMQNQLDRDIEIPLKRIPWLKYLFQFALPTFLISCGARTQGNIKVLGESKTAVTKSKEKIERESTGMVGMPLPEITYDTTKAIIPEKKPMHRPKKQKSIILPETARSSVSKESMSPLKKPMSSSMPFQQLVRMVGGGVCVRVGGVRPTTCSVKKTPKPLAFFRQIFKDTAFSNFRIYPNPVRSNSTLHIQWNSKEYGNHILELFNQSGQLVFKRQMYIDEKITIVSVDIRSEEH